MTDTSKPPVANDTAAKKAGSIWSELGPTLAFILIYNVLLRFPEGEGLLTKDTALYWATGALIVMTFAVVIQKLVKGQRIPPFLLVSSALIGSFGIAGILLQSKIFLFVKPDIINLIYASVIFGGLAGGTEHLENAVLHRVSNWPDFAWKNLALRWGIGLPCEWPSWNEFPGAPVFTRSPPGPNLENSAKIR